MFTSSQGVNGTSTLRNSKKKTVKKYISAITVPLPVSPVVRVRQSGRTPKDRMDIFAGQMEDPAAAFSVAISGLVFADFAKRIRSDTGLPLKSQQVQEALAILYPKISEICNHLKPQRANCKSSYPYRMPDGSCNNPSTGVLKGAALTAQARFVDPEYGDPDNLGHIPRIYGKNGKLTSPREISNVVLSTTEDFRSPKSTRYTLTLVHFAQFVDHDVIKTPATKIPNSTANDIFNEQKIEDCDEDCVKPKEHCFPFKIPDDHFQNDFGTKCMHFVRNKPAPSEWCLPGPRHQLNERTAFLDLSATYGSSQIRVNELRQWEGGRLNASKDDLLPDGPPVGDCLPDQVCFNSGDYRFQEIPMLTVIHIVFLREHNRIAGILSNLNRHWNDEKLFQESKKILTGIYQHIIYNEFLPLLVGRDMAYGSNLMSSKTAHRNSFSAYADPSTLNEFGAAAFRFGHSLVGRHIGSMNRNFKIKASEEMRRDFFNNDKMRDLNIYGPTRMGRWMAETLMRKRDRFISDQIRNHLFETKFDGPSDGFDLASLNIQRGRDHGIPGYNKLRMYCGLYPSNVFNTGPMGFRDHDHETVKKLSQVYRHTDDVDLFVGGITEKPSCNGEILGPTFKCLIAQQFQRYKEGDRFFYENNFQNTGFTLEQLNDIKKQTFAGIYCRSLKLKTIQPKVFEKGGTNRRLHCDSIPSPDLNLWKEN
ncbi:PXDN [Mytilus edulis]|uniref:PXDN n=1 Tax=Mytilus edulis TaxID=6550 RepID=A0A8S3PZ09_MYTED|nr:PXDN [Mytilus edulis]